MPPPPSRWDPVPATGWRGWTATRPSLSPRPGRPGRPAGSAATSADLRAARTGCITPAWPRPGPLKQGGLAGVVDEQAVVAPPQAGGEAVFLGTPVMQDVA